jgi:hypothetical protein
MFFSYAFRSRTKFLLSSFYPSRDKKVVLSLTNTHNKKISVIPKTFSRSFGQLKCPKGKRNNDGYLVLIGRPYVNSVKERLQERKKLRKFGKQRYNRLQ